MLYNVKITKVPNFTHIDHESLWINELVAMCKVINACLIEFPVRKLINIATHDKNLIAN